MNSLIRKSWPKIRVVVVKGESFYQVDARRKGTNGKREHFQNRKEAESRAREIEEDYRLEGAEGLSMCADLRVQALRGQATLDKFGKSLGDAVAFYAHHLTQEEKRKNSLTINALVDSWLAAKANGGNKPLRKDTLDSIREASKTLKSQWGEKRIAELTEKDFQNYLDHLKVSQRRKYNVRSLFSQFFNWCLKSKHTAENPLKEIEIQVLQKDIQILSVAECLAIMDKLQGAFTHLIPYHAVCMFGGLRPTEAKLLKWENIHLAERQITVFGSTSKTKETRNVKIEENLFHWLNEWKGTKKGFIIKQKGYRTALEKFRIAMGYRINGENPDGPKWIEDIMRHTYASYWLGKYNDRPHLAEQMGNSLKMIKSHYKQIVRSSDVMAYWRLLPEGVLLAKDNKLKKVIKDLSLNR